MKVFYRKPLFAYCAAIAGVVGLCTLASAIDLDGNGLNDLWEANYPGLQPDNPATGDDCRPVREDNPDGDGTGVVPNRNHYTNEVESKLGTDPFDGTCPMPLRIAVVPDGAGGRQVRLTFPTVVGKVYQVEYGVAVALPREQWYGLPECDGTTRTIKGYTRWQPLAEVVGNGQEAVIFAAAPQPGEAVQYRYRYLREVDQDGDGAADGVAMQAERRSKRLHGLDPRMQEQGGFDGHGEFFLWCNRHRVLEECAVAHCCSLCERTTKSQQQSERTEKYVTQAKSLAGEPRPDAGATRRADRIYAVLCVADRGRSQRAWARVCEPHCATGT